MHKTLLGVTGSAILALSILLTGCNKENTTETSGNDATKKNIIIGTTVGDFGDMVKYSIKPVLEKKGYQVKLIEFTDYIQPNLALNEGSIDANVFQHKPYLDNFKKEHKVELSSVFQVPTAPLGVYSGKLSKLEDAKDNMRISIPNDPSNFARGLIILDELKWIKLKDDIDPLTASEKDIAENPKNIRLIQLEAAQLPRTRDDVDFAIINGNYAVSSGIKLTEALYQEPSFAYVNWGVVRTKDINTPWVKDIIDAYNSDEFKAYSHQKFMGYKYPANWQEGHH